MFTPNLSILPMPQKKLWSELGATPRAFVLYGGTALALHLGHRQSEDFDFFCNKTFQPSALLASIAYLKKAEISQFQENTLTAIVDREGSVKVSFFGAVGLDRVQDPDVIAANGIRVASAIDLIATKLKTIQQRALAKDYIDVASALETGLDLAEALAAAEAVYGKSFNGALSLKALAYFEDGDLPNLSREVRDRLLKAAASVDLRNLPHVMARPGITQEEG
jgi:nucleotidyltransferase AbiEii toxin of type IV toxin-antitoxin system